MLCFLKPKRIVKPSFIHIFVLILDTSANVFARSRTTYKFLDIGKGLSD